MLCADDLNVNLLNSLTKTLCLWQNADVRQMYINAQAEWINHLKVVYGFFSLLSADPAALLSDP